MKAFELSTSLNYATMATESDPNVVYGGDPSETTAIDPNIASLGEMIQSDLKLGADKTSFVRNF